MSKSKLWSLFIHLMVVLLAVDVVFLVYQNRKLQSQIAAIAADNEPPGLSAGEYLSSMDLVDLAGTYRMLEYGDGSSDRLLFVFTTTCPICAEIVDTWQSLHEELASAVEILGISGHSVAETLAYAEEHNLSYPIFVGDRDSLRQQLKISFVPQTIVVRSSGVVAGVWEGVLGADDLQEIKTTAASY